MWQTLHDSGEVSIQANGDAGTGAARTTGVRSSGWVGRTLAEVERDLILGTLDHCRGNRTHAARILGISIRTLRNRLGQYTNAGNDARHGRAYENDAGHQVAVGVSRGPSP